MAKKNATAVVTEEQKAAQELSQGVTENTVSETVSLGAESASELDLTAFDKLDAQEALRTERAFERWGRVRDYIGNGGTIELVSRVNFAKQDGTDVQVWLVPANGLKRRKATCSSYQSEMLRSGEMSLIQLAVMDLNFKEAANGDRYIKLSVPTLEETSPVTTGAILDTEEITFVPQEIDLANLRLR